MNGHDELDATVAAEFASYRHVAGQAFDAPSAEAVFATARSRTVRRRAAAVVAVAVGVVTVLVTGTVVAGAITANEPEIPASPQPAPTELGPAPSPADGYDEDPPPVPDRGNQVQFLDDETAQRVRNMTIELPGLPAFDDVCPAGEYTFTDGQATIEEHESGYPWSYWVLFKGRSGIVADVDGEDGDEILVPLGCGIGELHFGLLALRQVGDGFQTMGYVMVASDEIGGPDRFFPDGDEIVVEVSTPTIASEFEQRRRYRWQDSQFVQVGGPTELPADPTDLTSVDPRNWAFSISPEEGTMCGTGGMLSFVDGGSGAWSYVSEEDGVDWPAAEYLMHGVSRGSLDGVGTQPALLVTLTCSRPDGHSETWVHRVNGGQVVRVGDEGVTAIVSHRIVDGLAEVTVETANGQETRRYRTDGMTW